jgi:hypothetical protein
MDLRVLVGEKTGTGFTRLSSPFSDKFLRKRQLNIRPQKGRSISWIDEQISATQVEFSPYSYWFFHMRSCKYILDRNWIRFLYSNGMVRASIATDLFVTSLPYAHVKWIQLETVTSCIFLLNFSEYIMLITFPLLVHCSFKWVWDVTSDIKLR